MSDLAIRVEKLGKQYRIDAGQPRYRTFREALIDGVSGPVRRLRGLTPTVNGQAIWALRDVSFEVKRGEVLGIIGRNGAGKSTLLKILCRITEPTEGHAEIQGRVGSLLEVGTGFHLELTGRENVFLNGAILGMTRAKIQRRFDEIVAFAEVEQFIDTPVKRYSSGMYMRLAFAVAAHLEPEILLVDEVLAVGDAAFQKKCLGKMGDVAKEGRTVLFVSHNMAAILRLCGRAILLNGGQAVTQGPAPTVVDCYLGAGVEQDPLLNLEQLPRAEGLKGRARLVNVRLLSQDKVGAWKLLFGSDIALEVGVKVLAEVSALELGMAVCTNTGFEIASSLSSHALPNMPFKPGEYCFRAFVHDLTLAPGVYRFGLGLRANHELQAFEDYLPEAFDVEILISETAADYKMDTIRAVIIPKVHFEVTEISHATKCE